MQLTNASTCQPVAALDVETALRLLYIANFYSPSSW